MEQKTKNKIPISDLKKILIEQRELSKYEEYVKSAINTFESKVSELRNYLRKFVNGNGKSF